MLLGVFPGLLDHSPHLGVYSKGAKPTSLHPYGTADLFKEEAARVFCSPVEAVMEKNGLASYLLAFLLNSVQHYKN